MLRSLVAPPTLKDPPPPPVEPSPDADAPEAAATTSETPEILLRRNLSRESLEAAIAEGCYVWIDAVDPDDDEIKWLGQMFELHPQVMSDLRRDDRRPTLMPFPDYLFLSLFQPTVTVKDKQSIVASSEIHCLIGARWLLTVRGEGVKAVDSAYDRAAQNVDYWKRELPYLLYMVMQAVIDSYYPLIDRISNQLNLLEEKAMNEGDKSLQKSVFRLKQQLINLRQMVAPQREVVSNVIGEDRLASTPEDRDLFRHLYERLLRIYDVIDSQRDLASNVLDLLESQESGNLAKAVGRLTVLSMLFLPPTFIVGLFGLNFVTTSPEFEIPVSGGALFLIIVLLTVIMSAGIAWFFRKQGWL
jgi:magnesium transporter